MRAHKKTGIGHNSGKAQTAAERAKSLYQRRTALGWRKTWVDPDTQALADQCGGIEKIASEYHALERKIRDLEAQQVDQEYLMSSLNDVRAELVELLRRGFWSRLLNRRK